MGIGHVKIRKSRTHRQLSLIPRDWKHEFNHGGILRKKRKGRGCRPLTRKDPMHLVFKINKTVLRVQSLRHFRVLPLIRLLIYRYAKKFFVKIESISVNHDHIHILVRCSRREQYLNFFRVVSGQIAQVLELEGFIDRRRPAVTDTSGAGKPSGSGRLSLWKYRPFSRVVRGWKAFLAVTDYIQLNEKEASGKIKYNSRRLRGLSTADWQLLWV